MASFVRTPITAFTAGTIVSLALAAGCSSGADALFSSGSSGSGEASSVASSGNGGSGGDSQTVAVVSSSVGVGGAGTTTVSVGTSMSQTSTVGTTISTAVSSSSSGGGIVLDCGNQTCTNGSACCWDEYMVSGNPQGECVTDENACETDGNNGFESYITCQQPSDCGSGETCCARRVVVQTGQGQASYYDELSCTTDACEWPDIVMCDPSIDDTVQCPQIPSGNGGTVQSVCKQSQLLPDGYFVCGNP